MCDMCVWLINRFKSSVNKNKVHNRFINRWPGIESASYSKWQRKMLEIFNSVATKWFMCLVGNTFGNSWSWSWLLGAIVQNECNRRWWWCWILRAGWLRIIELSIWQTRIQFFFFCSVRSRLHFLGGKIYMHLDSSYKIWVSSK